MAWELILWILFLIFNFTLLFSNIYQFIALTDLEEDYINPYELSSRINYLIVPEYLLHGVFCVSFLVTGHWVMFLFTLPLAYYNMKLYLSCGHLIDVTEIFRVLNAEMKVRKIKLWFYGALLLIVFIRFAFSVVLAIFADDDEDLRGIGLP